MRESVTLLRRGVGSWGTCPAGKHFHYSVFIKQLRVASYNLRSSLQSQQPEGSPQPPTQTGAFLCPLEQKAFVTGINLPTRKTLSSGSYFADGNGVAMVTRLALHSGSLNLDKKKKIQEKYKIQIELQTTKLVFMTSCRYQIYNTDLADRSYMVGDWGDGSPVKCSE